MNSITDRHLDGTPWHHSLYEVAIILAAGRVRARARARAALVVVDLPPDDADGPRKRCRHCEKWRTFDKFSKHPTTADGYDGRCRDCKRIYDREWARKRREAAGMG